MTYCVALRLDEGVVFLADSRTNAGVDHVSTFRKLVVYERPNERVLVLLSAGNLAITQAVRELLNDPHAEQSLWNADSMNEAVMRVGDAVREIHRRDGHSLHEFHVDFNISLILGGQIRGEPCRLYQIYSAGNFIEAMDETCYFQIGEAKYGKPILDRVVTPDMSMDEAAKCALVSMDSTLRSNISVGLPLDLLCYRAGALRVDRFAHIDADNAYFRQVQRTWGQRLRQVFEEVPAPPWEHVCDEDDSAPDVRCEPVRAPLPEGGRPRAIGPVHTLPAVPERRWNAQR